MVLKKQIPIPPPVSKSSYKQDPKIGNDFYTWVNKPWMDSVEIPEYESDFGISEEVERHIFRQAIHILKEVKESSYRSMFKELYDSCMNESVQNNNILFLRETLGTLDCIRDVDDVVYHFATLCKLQFSSIFKLQYAIEPPNKMVRLLLDSDSPGLHYTQYENQKIMKEYRDFIETIEEKFETPNLHKIFTLEKLLVFSSENLWSEHRTRTKGSQLEKKFPRFPWKLWFETLGLKEWRSMVIYYNSPRWIRFIGKLLHSVPIEYWKLYLKRCYILNCIRYLPPPYDEIDYSFFGAAVYGQKRKVPQQELFIRIVYDFLQDEFSRLYWEKAGDPKLVPEINTFTENLLEAAKTRLESVDWLQYKTRLAAIRKVDQMDIQTVRPKTWMPTLDISLDPTNLLKNIFLLGERNVRIMLTRLGKRYQFWEEGIFRVNAYYFNENNEMVIPYGTCLSPFYSHTASPAWNYGALGCIIGHEMCHGFDEEGKEYNEKGEKKRWWLRSDNMAYKKKTRALVELFGSQVIAHRRVKGGKTLSENIADLGGVGIGLEALKQYLHKNGIVDPEKVKEEYKTFFRAYATSWRTKYRQQKLQSAINMDVHAPAELRVNLIVSQFDEWYAAFDIDSSADLYQKPEERIRIF